MVLCCISKLELMDLCMITTLLLVLLSSCVSRFNDLTNAIYGVILGSFEYSPVLNLAALFLICSSLSMFTLVEGSHTKDAHCSTGLTKVR